ncbi:hypothetical protein B4U80_00249 [Leptotrombidium deliense]|uniref:Phenazine biosynthesis-like domain-containing protein n=1 Tax=Leptotrombidium deliense TaxID=299467 RepID=A0A443RZW6_9ACAR|nr:hypothetical protein B4U80_00249 [Leptotrombidium deliense]
MALEYYVVDAFTVNDELFTGNQAAVIVLNNDNELSDEIKQGIAFEINLSETAFVSPIEGNKYYLRWFTPTTEVDLCGHATLATASVLFRKLKNEKCLTFVTKDEKILKAVFNKENNTISLDFPSNRPEVISIAQYPFVREIVKLTIGDEAEYKLLKFSKNTGKLVVQLNSSVKFLKSIKPDFLRLMAIKENSIISGVIVTLEGKTNEIDFHSRYFAPWKGINEDPVTGSAHTVLIPFWSEIKNKNTFVAKQESKRGGILFCELIGERVKLSGKCRQVITGQFLLK